jgi:hypothetical protein
MPISGPSSYPPTTREFLDHWAALNTELGAEVVLAGGASVGELGDQLENLETAREAVTDKGVDRALAREYLDALIRKLQGKLVEFNARIRSDFAGTVFERVLSVAFAVGDAEDAVRDGLRRLAHLWSKVNAMATPPTGVTLPVALQGNYSILTLNADRTALRDLYGALTQAEVDLKLAREARNDIQDVIYPILKAYRLKVPTAVAANDALLDSLPSLTPPAGHTPDAVTLQGAWNATEAKAEFTWEESAEAQLARYELRGVPGDEFNAEDEQVIATVPAGGTRAASSAFALGTPGLTASFKVYVVLQDGHEKGSEAVAVHRPG